MIQYIFHAMAQESQKTSVNGLRPALLRLLSLKIHRQQKISMKDALCRANSCLSKRSRSPKIDRRPLPEAHRLIATDTGTASVAHAEGTYRIAFAEGRVCWRRLGE